MKLMRGYWGSAHPTRPQRRHGARVSATKAAVPLWELQADSGVSHRKNTLPTTLSGPTATRCETDNNYKREQKG